MNQNDTDLHRMHVLGDEGGKYEVNMEQAEKFSQFYPHYSMLPRQTQQWTVNILLQQFHKQFSLVLE